MQTIEAGPITSEGCDGPLSARGSIAITAVTAKSIEDSHTVNLEALTGAVPNVQIGHFSNTPTSATFSIRGMSVVDPDPYAGQTVTVVMDGVPLVFNIVSLPDLF